MAETGKGTLARAAMAAAVEQTDAAVRAEVDLLVFQVHQPLATWAHILGQARQGHVVAQLLAALLVGHGFGLLLALQVAVERQDGVAPDQHRDTDAHHIAHIAAIAGQVGHQFDEEGEQREKDEAPDKGPVGALALLHEQPACHHQQRQRERQAVQKDAQLHLAALHTQLLIGAGFHAAELPLRGRGGLARIEQGLLLRLDRLLRALFGLLQPIQHLGARHHLRVVLHPLRHAARGQPVVEGLARRLAFAARLAALQLRLLQRGLRILLGLALVPDLRAQLLGLGTVQKVIHLQRRLHLGQVAHDGAAQADQETRKHHRHQPQAATEPFFRQSQCFAHDSPLVDALPI